MTSGGLMQLVAYGAQDVYLTANPQVTFFKQLYRRHSNFAMESIEQTFNGLASFGKRVQCTIARNGDLITRVYVQATLPALTPDVVVNDATVTWVKYIGQYLIKDVYVEIGGQQIDKHYGEWLHIWNELTLAPGKAFEYTNMVNGYGGIEITPRNATCTSCDTEGSRVFNSIKRAYNEKLVTEPTVYSTFPTIYSQGVDPSIDDECIPEQTLYIPLEFWFNRHAGLALPLIALQYHEVKINIDFQDLQYLINVKYKNSPNDKQLTINNIASQGLVACSLYVDYIYLDTEERRRFAQVAHEYLIEQLQFTGTESVTSTSNKIKLQFNHPCKELIWVVQNPSVLDCESSYNYPNIYVDTNNGNPTAVAKIQLNGQDRFTEREGDYFNLVQPYQHHTRSPSNGINVYSFALKPEELQPSGSCNFSRIDNAVLNLTLTSATFGSVPELQNTSANVNVYATNYNVLRIMSGMGGLAYSN
jgi:hypothetical protein